MFKHLQWFDQRNYWANKAKYFLEIEARKCAQLFLLPFVAVSELESNSGWCRTKFVRIMCLCHGHLRLDGSPYNRVGQNLYIGGNNIEGAIRAWFNEKPDYDFETRTCKRNRMCGHYTQVLYHFYVIVRKKI